MARNQENSHPPGSCGQGAPSRKNRNRNHWNATLDARNLASQRSGPPLPRQLELAASLDVRLAFRQLAPLKGRLVLDLGAGLGLHAILLARAGANVVVCDISPNRLREARRLAAEAGVPDGRIRFAVAEAERLPFADAAFGGIFTKSVLIHTDLPRAAGECVRVLSPTGCATFIEPLDRNPFVVLYRLLLAPREWRHITRYFDKLAINELGHPFTKHGFQGTLTPVHYLGFFASIAQFQMESPKMMRAMERVLHRLDRMIFAVFPPFRRYAWFAIFKFSPRKAN